MRGKLATAVGAIALVLLGVILSVSFDNAAANGASYLRAIGVSGVPDFLRSALAGTILTIGLTAIVSVIATLKLSRWWRNRRPETTVDLGSSDYDLSASMSSLKYRMSEYLKYEGFQLAGDPNSILADCNSLNITLQKVGIPVPFVPSGDAQSMFKVLMNFYTQVGPLLRDGHREQALTAASAFSRRHPRPE